jgi:hypothetical protein
VFIGSLGTIFHRKSITRGYFTISAWSLTARIALIYWYRHRKSDQHHLIWHAAPGPTDGAATLMTHGAKLSILLFLYFPFSVRHVLEKMKKKVMKSVAVIIHACSHVVSVCQPPSTAPASPFSRASFFQLASWRGAYGVICPRRCRSRLQSRQC